MHLMVATVFKRHTDSCDLSLASSMDGKHWTWLPGGPVVEPGPDGSWDGGAIFGGIGLTEIPGNRVVSPYIGYQYPTSSRVMTPHMGRIGLAIWPSERLAAIVADEDGEFVTTPLASQGTKLFLNFQTKRNGYVKVAVNGANGRTIEACDPMFGDALEHQVTWKGEGTIGIEPGKSFDLHFKLRAAKLFSFELR